VTSAELSPASFFRIGSGWLLSFAQVLPDGVALRGASLRVHVGGDGGLVFAKAYLQRSAEERWRDSWDGRQVWLDRPGIEASVVAAGESLEDARQEYAFVEEAGFAPRPVWSLYIADSEGILRKELRDGASGALLSRCDETEYFDYEAFTRGRAADLCDVFAPRDEIVEAPQTLPYVMVLPEANDAAPRAVVERGSVSTLIRTNDLSPPVTTVLATSTYGVIPAEDAPCPPIPLAAPFNTGLPFPPDLTFWCPEAVMSPVLLQAGGRVDFPGRAQLPLPGPVAVHPPYLQDVLAGDAAETVDRVFVFNAAAAGFPPELAIAHSGWIQNLFHSTKVLEMAREAARADLPAIGRFRTLILRPIESVGPGVPAVFIETRLLPGLAGNILNYSPETRPATGERRPIYRVEATLIAHEVGHHLVEIFTGTRTSSPIEEAVADVIAAYALEESRIGYQKEDASENPEEPQQRRILPGPVGRDLARPFEELELPAPGDSEEERLRKLRPFVAGGFWALWQGALDNRLRQARVERLLFRWLADQRGEGGDPRGIEDVSCLLHELLALNDALDRDDPPRAGQVSTIAPRSLVEAFDCRLFHRDIPFIRGDADLDFAINLSDPVNVLRFLFTETGYHDCRDAMDADDDDTVGISDPIFLLNYLFLGGPGSPAPFPGCGFDPTEDELCCLEFTCPAE
jgi:hypothetical protein